VLYINNLREGGGGLCFRESVCCIIQAIGDFSGFEVGMGARILHVLLVIFVILWLFTADSWLAFVDLQSLIVVVVPAITAFLVGRQRSKLCALHCTMHVSWISGLLGSLIFFSLVLNQTEVDAIGMMWGARVVLLPITYGVIGVLLLLPFVMAGKITSDAGGVEEN